MRALAVSAVPALLIVAGCGGGTQITTPSPITSTVTCPVSNVDDQLGQAVGTGRLADGSTIVSSQQVYNTTDRAKIDVVFRICGNAATQGDALKATATEIAAKLEASPLGEKVATMRVTNLSGGDSPAAKVRCENFPTWNFTEGAAGTERAPWRTLAE